MSLKDFLFGKQPMSTTRPGPLPRPLTITPAPSFQPLPGDPANIVDAKVSELWRLHLRQFPGASWDNFLASLTADNAERVKRRDELQKRLPYYSREDSFVP